MVFSMAFDRKWVSDTNLDKLWSDALDKKEANKQRRSPDFCKEAILSATLKRISSEMLMRRLSSPTIDVDLNSDDEDDTLTVLTSVSRVMDCDDQINFLKNLPEAEAGENKCSKSEPATPSDTKENSLSELCTAIEMTEIEPIPRSPKRKWSDTDGNDIESINTSSIQCSPAKKSRPEARSCERSSRSNSPRHRKRSQSPAPSDASNNSDKIKTKKKLFSLPKVKIIPADDESSSSKTTELNMALLTPVRSVANSISELSIEVDDALKSNDDSWCLKVAPQPIHTDPLELDGFFNNLRKVTS